MDKIILIKKQDETKTNNFNSPAVSEDKTLTLCSKETEVAHVSNSEKIIKF